MKIIVYAAAALGLCLIGLAAPQSAKAASFDCAKAATSTEIAICRTPTLSDLDVQMSTLYGVRMQIPMLMGSRGAAQDEQRAFIAQRNSCGASVPCLRQSYQGRIAALNQTIQSAMNDYCIRLGICG